LVNPVAILIFSSFRRALGAAGDASGSVAHRLPHEYLLSRQLVQETPVFMRVRRARRWLQCDFRLGKVKVESAISTIFFGFLGYFA
jgi:hypothetical protein